MNKSSVLLQAIKKSLLQRDPRFVDIDVREGKDYNGFRHPHALKEKDYQAWLRLDVLVADEGDELEAREILEQALTDSFGQQNLLDGTWGAENIRIDSPKIRALNRAGTRLRKLIKAT